MAEIGNMALHVNTISYFDCFCHQEHKNTSHDGLWELTPLTLLIRPTRLALLKPPSLFSPCLCMNTLLYFDCWGHQELKNIALNGLKELCAATRDWTDHTP